MKFPLILASALALSFPMAVKAADLTIDEFTTTQIVTIVGSAPPAKTLTDTINTLPLDTIGNYRTITLTKFTGVPGGAGRVEAESGVMGTLGALTIGLATGQLQLDYNTSGAGLNLSLANYSQFETLIQSSDHTLIANAKLCVNLACTSYLTNNVTLPTTFGGNPIQNTPFVLIDDLSNFTGVGGATLNSIIQTIRFTLTTSVGQEGLDLSLDYIRLKEKAPRDISEPSILLPILGIGLLGLMLVLTKDEIHY